MIKRQVKTPKTIFNYYGVKVYPKTGRAVILDKSNGAKVLTLSIPKGSKYNSALTAKMIKAAKKVKDKPRAVLPLLRGLDTLTFLFEAGASIYINYPNYIDFKGGGFKYKY